MIRRKSLCGVLLIGVLLAGCGGEGGGDESSSGVAADSGSAGDSGAGSGSGSGGPADSAAVKPADARAEQAANAPAAATRLVRTAEISLEVSDIGQATRAVRSSAVALGGLISTESTGFDPIDENEEGDEGSTGDRATQGHSEISLRVPEPRMDDALDRIAKVGRELDRSTTSEDVTATMADLDSRVSTQTRSVARVRDLLAKANSLQDVVLLESELSKREADLESVQARQRALSDKATLATVNVTLRTKEAAVDDTDEAGFLAGLGDGWTALQASTTVVLTVLGALLPIAVVLAVLGVPAYYLRRRFRAGRLAQPVAGPSPSPAPGPTPAAAP